MHVLFLAYCQISHIISLPSNCSLIILSLNTVALEVCLEDMIDIGIFLFIALEQVEGPPRVM